jgi:hypothetical protein
MHIPKLECNLLPSVAFQEKRNDLLRIGALAKQCVVTQFVNTGTAYSLSSVNDISDRILGL